MNKSVFLFFLLTVFIITGCDSSDSSSSSSPNPPGVNNPGNEDFIFVDSANGTAGGHGTREDPLDDLEEAYSLACLLNRSLCVARGSYDFTRISLKENSSLYGGYRNNSGSWTRNVSANVTTLNASGTGFGSSRIVDDSNITRNTIIDGLIINGGTKTYIISCYGSPTISNCTVTAELCLYSVFVIEATASPLITGCTINGRNGADPMDSGALCLAGPAEVTGCVINGGNSGNINYCIRCDNSSPVISDNTINGGAPTGVSYSIYCENSSPVISGNTINGGDSTGISYCIACNASSPVISNNVIKGGAPASSSFGIYCVDSDPLVEDNTINGGAGISTCCIYTALDTEVMYGPNIQYNTLLVDGGTQRYGIYEYDDGFYGPAAVFYNRFHSSLLGGGAVNCCYYSEFNGSTRTNCDTIEEVNALTGGSSFDRIRWNTGI